MQAVEFPPIQEVRIRIISYSDAETHLGLPGLPKASHVEYTVQDVLSPVSGARGGNFAPLGWKEVPFPLPTHLE